MRGEDSATPFDGDRWLKIKPKVLLWLIGIVALGVTSWGAIKFDVVVLRKDLSDQGRAVERMASQLETIQREATTAREAVLTMKYQQDLINAKLDYLTGDKRGPRPAAGAP